MLRKAACLVATGYLALVAQNASAQTPAEFYKGKTVNIIVGFSPGGGYDQYGRLLARRIGENIPGKPTVVVQNAPGAGSLTAVRRLDAGLPRDGTSIVIFNPALITEAILEPEKIKFKFTDVTFIGSVTRDFRVCFMWHATGAKTWDDVMKRPQVIFGSTSKGTGAYVNQAILKNVFGIKAKQILGFPGSAEQRIAIERGELEGELMKWIAMAQPSLPSFNSLPDIREKWLVSCFGENKVDVDRNFAARKDEMAKTVEKIAKFNTLIIKPWNFRRMILIAQTKSRIRFLCAERLR